jgi:hypothetical protein
VEKGDRKGKLPEELLVRFKDLNGRVKEFDFLEAGG